MTVVLLEPGKEEHLVLPNRAAGGESENIVAEDRLWNAHQPVEIRNRVKPLRLEAPEQSAVQIVGAGFRDHIEHASTRAPELDAEVPRLHGNFLNGVGDGKNLLCAAYPDIVVFGPVEHVVIPARALTVDGEPSAIVSPVGRPAAPDSAAGSFRRARQGPRQRERIQGSERQLADLSWLEGPAA